VPKRNDINKVLIIGSGPIVIGQGCEFDYSGTQGCTALRKLGYRIVLVNSNPSTVSTDPGMADATYIEPLNLNSIEKIIAAEHPDALLPNLGGQTALNITFQLAKAGILEKYGVRIIGVQANSIERCEDRQAFKDMMARLGIETARSEIVRNLEEAERILERVDFPCVIRPSCTVGGTGAGIVFNPEEFQAVTSRAFSASSIGPALIEESLEGWEELELEVVRDGKGQKITICFIENIDPMGIHSGDSFCATPMLTIDPQLQAKLQDYSYRIVDEIGLIGGAGIRYAHDPGSQRIVAVGINTRASRTSAFASKATGIPIALVSSLLACGLSLDEIPHGREGSLEKYIPQLDYVAIRAARWMFDKFKDAEDRLGVQMHAVGQIMAFGKSFKEALQKSIRALETGRMGLGFAKDFNHKSLSDLMALLWHPSSERIFMVYEAIRKGANLKELCQQTHIKPWYIQQLKELVELEEKILKYKGGNVPDDLLVQAKKDGFADAYIATLLEIPEERVRNQRVGIGMIGARKSISVSGIENAVPYYYSTYNAPDPGAKIAAGSRKKVMILGGGPNRIGEGIECDYCCVHAAFALRDLGYDAIMVNCNPGAVSTDADISSSLYFEPLTVEDVLGICNAENPIGVIVQLGGQTPLNISRKLEQAGVKILGTLTDSIDLTQDRDRFRSIMQKLGIPQPSSGIVRSIGEAVDFSDTTGYPLVARSYSELGGEGMGVLHDRDDLSLYVSRATETRPDVPIRIDRFMENALAVEVDALSDGKSAFIPAIMEHIELAGIHSGDSACVLPCVSIPEEQQKTIEEYTKRIAIELKVQGFVNIQYAIAHGEVYVLEVTPRASRTVPLVSRVCNIPMARLATRIMLDEKLADLHLTRKTIAHHGVKEAVFPFNMLPGVDPVLGPEMHSTGEVLGLADSFELAFYKAQEAAEQLLPQKGTVLISVSDADKSEALELAREFRRLGFKIRATEGTQQYLARYGIECDKISKMSAGRPNIVDAIKNGEIQLVINTPIGKRGTSDDSYIRKAAIKHKLPYITTMAAARAAVKGLAAYRQKAPEVVSLQKYYAGIK